MSTEKQSALPHRLIWVTCALVWASACGGTEVVWLKPLGDSEDSPAGVAPPQGDAAREELPAEAFEPGGSAELDDRARPDAGTWTVGESFETTPSVHVSPPELGVPPVDSLDPPVEPRAVSDPCALLDVLFVVDNSSSMAEEQERLARGMPALVEVLESLEGISQVHAAIVDTDGLPGFFDCDHRLGAGRREDAEGNDCGLRAESRYLELGRDPLGEGVSCLTRVGTNGAANEAPAWAMLEALRDPTSPGACNSGFLREEGVLLVTIITDSDDLTTPGLPATWRDEVLSMRDPDRVVMLGLLGTSLELDVTDSETSAPGVRIGSFIRGFRHHRIGDISAPSYAPFLAGAVTQVSALCSELKRPL